MTTEGGKAGKISASSRQQLTTDATLAALDTSSATVVDASCIQFVTTVLGTCVDSPARAVHHTVDNCLVWMPAGCGCLLGASCLMTTAHI